MSHSKPLPPFTFDLLCCLNRDQLERFSIVCRPLKNFIERYFRSKPFRVFDRLKIRGGMYVLFHKVVQWHPNRDDYSAQQFLARQRCQSVKNTRTRYSFTAMRPYLGPTVRIKRTVIHVAGYSTYNSEHIAEIESITYLWRDGNIRLRNDNGWGCRIVAEDFQPILNSPTILQCRELYTDNAHFSFKDYKVLYAVKVIEARHCHEIDPSYWSEFLEQSEVKPVVVFPYLRRADVDKLVDRLSKAFYSAVSPNAFKIVFANCKDPLVKFQETNSTSREKLDLNKRLPEECQVVCLDGHDNYTLERSSI